MELYFGTSAENLFTFAMVFMVLHVATTKGIEGNSYFGWAIGCTVLVGAYAVGSISRGVINPNEVMNKPVPA